MSCHPGAKSIQGKLVYIVTSIEDDYTANNRARYGWLRHNCISFLMAGWTVRILAPTLDFLFVYDRLELPREIEIICYLPRWFTHRNRFLDFVLANAPHKSLFYTRDPRLASLSSRGFPTVLEYHDEDYQDVDKFKESYDEILRNDGNILVINPNLKEKFIDFKIDSCIEEVESGTALLGLEVNKVFATNLPKFKFLYAGSLHDERQPSFLYRLFSEFAKESLLINSNVQHYSRFRQINDLLVYPDLRYSEIYSCIRSARVCIYTRAPGAELNTSPIKIFDYLYASGGKAYVVLPKSITVTLPGPVLEHFSDKLITYDNKSYESFRESCIQALGTTNNNESYYDSSILIDVFQQSRVEKILHSISRYQ